MKRWTDDDPPPLVEPDPAGHNRWMLPLWRFVKVLAAIVIIGAVLTAIPEEAATWLFVYSLPLIFIGAVAFSAYLWRRGRLVLLLHVIVAVALLTAAQFALMKRDAARIATFDQRHFLPTTIQHNTIVSYWGSGPCWALCMEILTKTDYRPVSEIGISNEWVAFAKVSGAACMRADNRESYIEFLAAGFADVCAIRSVGPKEDTAMVVSVRLLRSRSDRSWKTMSEDLPRSFSGDVYELYERTNGEERLLGRWVRGYVRPVSYWFGLVGLRGWRVGADFDEHQFYGAAVQARLAGGPYPGDSDLSRVFDQLELLLNHPEFGREALNAYRSLAQWKGGMVPAMLEARSARLLNSAEPGRILAGFALLGLLDKPDPGPYRSRIIALLDYSDSRVVAAALNAAFELPEHGGPQLEGKLVALADSPVLASANSPVLRPLLGHLRGRFPNSVRDHAKRQLIENAGLSAAQRTALLAIVVRGGDAMREDAGAAIRSMSDEALFDIVLAVADLGWPAISDRRRDRWTDQEMAHLVERAKNIQLDRLVRFVNGIRTQEAFKTHTAEMADVLRMRLDAAAEPSLPDDENLRNIKAILQRL
jgi:hypothetical protein